MATLMDWFEPRSFSEWIRRVCGLRPILLLLLIIGLFVAEMRFDWIERALGIYLVKTNAGRPEYGSIWETGHRKLAAQKTLEKMMTDRLATQREVREADSFLKVADSITGTDGGIMLSTDQFRTLYLNLPPAVAREILSPFELIHIMTENEWVRTYIEKKDSGLNVYMLDQANRVVQEIEITAEMLYQIKQQYIARSGSLDTMPRFNHRIYPSDVFFSVLLALDEDTRRNVIPQPENLLNSEGRISRVGISDEAVAGFIEIGFEFDTGAEKNIIVVQGREWAVWQLRSRLEEKEPRIGSFGLKKKVGIP